MTQQWQLSGNAERVDWSDLAMAGRAYADNLVGEPAISKVMHMMADEIERLRSHLAAKTATAQLRNRALSGCETVPDPDSRVWETPCTPQPHATPSQGSVPREGSVPRSGTENEPVAWAVETGGELEASFCGPAGREDAADWREQSDGVIVPLYRLTPFTLTDEEREAVAFAYSRLTADSKYEAVADTLRKLLERMG